MRARAVAMGLGLGVVVAAGGAWFASTRPRPVPTVGASMAAPMEDGLPVLGMLPKFQLVREDGRAFGSAELVGKPWVVDFFFTSCGGVCPRLTASMRKLQERIPGLGTRAMLVSISVDPEEDVPAVLTKYGKENAVDPSRWVLLTGDSASVQEVVIRGFKLRMGQGDAGDHKVFHAERFVLVDAKGRIRGYYENDDAGLERLVAHVTELQ